MDKRVTLKPHSDWNEEERASLRDLSLLVYRPRETARWPGSNLEWAQPQWGVRAEGMDGTLLSYAGLVLREAKHDDRPVLIGGIGSVKTRPDARRRGYASLTLNRAADFFREHSAAEFALLVCEPHLLSFYSRLGWREFVGHMLTQQHGETVEFTFNRVMVLDVESAAPSTGTLDLLGPPW